MIMLLSGRDGARPSRKGKNGGPRSVVAAWKFEKLS